MAQTEQAKANVKKSLSFNLASTGKLLRKLPAPVD